MKQLYDRFQEIMMDQLPIIPLYRRYSFMAVYSKWGNINWDTKHSAGENGLRIYLKDTLEQ
jgi:ABC-type transport system substrate-binding protein